MEQIDNLLDLLGYSTKQLHDTRCGIYDEIGEEVGFVQKKKIHNKNKKKGLPAKYGYFVEIDSDKIKYQDAIPEDHSRKSECYHINFGENKNDRAEMSMTEHSFNLTIWNEKYGYIQFNVGFESLFLNFTTRHKKHLIEEVMLLKYDFDENRKYAYSMSFCDKKEKNVDDAKHKKTFRICGEKFPHEEEMKITENYWKNGELENEIKTESNSSIEEMIDKHEMGINAFNRLMPIIDEILPFEKGILDIIREGKASKHTEKLELFDKTPNINSKGYCKK